MLRLGLLLLIVPGVVLMGVFWSELGSVNACLAEGGSYDYLKQVCNMETNQPFIPFAERHPLFVNMTMLASAAGLGLCLIGLYVRAR